jgi:hypothetical protein
MQVAGEPVTLFTVRGKERLTTCPIYNNTKTSLNPPYLSSGMIIDLTWSAACLSAPCSLR